MAAPASATTATAPPLVVEVDRSVRIPDDDAVYTSKVVYERAQFALVLYRDRLAFFGADSKRAGGAPAVAFAVFLEDVYGAELRTRQAKGQPDVHEVVVHLFVPKGRDKTRGDPVHGVDPKRGRANEYYFEALTLRDQIAWVNHISAALRGITVAERPLDLATAVNARPRRRVYIVINPFGGEGKAPKIYKSTVAPMLARAGIEADVVETESPLHGTQLMKALPLNKYIAIVSISGDGLLHELLNGLLDRPDWPQAVKTPFAIIPAGSGNAIAKSMDCEDPAAATFALIRGKAAPWDIMGIKQGERILYSHLSLTHGLIADIDIGFETFRAQSAGVALRFMGAARYTMGAVIRLINVRTYHTQFAYMPAGLARAPIDYDTPTTSTASSGSRFGPRLQFADLTFDTIPSGWVKQEVDLSTFIASKASWLSLDLQTCPDARLGDGLIDLLTTEENRTRMVWRVAAPASNAAITMLTAPPSPGWVARGGCGQLVPYFLDTESGDVARAPFVRYLKVQAVYLNPVSGRGFVAIDGEGMPVQPAVAEIFPGLARLMMPFESVHSQATPAPVPLPTSTA